MMRRGTVGAALAVAVMALAGAGAWDGVGAQESGVAWSGTLEPGQTLEVRGVLGRISAGPADSREGEIRFEKSARRSDPSEVGVEVVEHAGGVTVCAVYPGTEGRCEPGSSGNTNLRNNDVTVAFDVRVPAGVRFRGVTVNGEVQARGLRGGVEAHTVNGSIEISTTGWAEAETVNGSIRASLGEPTPDRELNFSTVNGGITLELPSNLNAEVEASWVNGGLESDLPLTVQGRFTNRRARGVLGEGGHLLTLSTVNGPIRLRSR